MSKQQVQLHFTVSWDTNPGPVAPPVDEDGHFVLDIEPERLVLPEVHIEAVVAPKDGHP